MEGLLPEYSPSFPQFSLIQMVDGESGPEDVDFESEDENEDFVELESIPRRLPRMKRYVPMNCC